MAKRSKRVSGFHAAMLLAWAAGACALSACATPKANDVPVAATAPAGPAARCSANATGAAAGAIHPLAVGASGGGGSTVALGTIGDRTVAWIADADAKAIVAFDVDGKKVLAATPVPGTPAQLLVTNDGHLAVTLRDASVVQLYTSNGADRPLQLACEAKAPAEPIGIAEATNGELVVASGWGRALTVFSSRLERRGSVALGREPRAVVVEGERAFVSHMVGAQMSIVDLADLGMPKVLPLKGNDTAIILESLTSKVRDEPAGDDGSSLRDSCQGFALAKMVAPRERVFAPEVFVSPGEKTVRTSGYGGSGSGDDVPTEVPNIAVIDAKTAAPLPLSLSMPDLNSWGSSTPQPRDHAQGCLLPRAAAIDPTAGSLLVACMGIDSIVAYDALATNPELAPKTRWRVGAGPNGIAVDAAHRRAVVFASFPRSVHVIDLDEAPDADDRAIAGVALAPLARPLAADVALGRALFHTTDDVRISKDGRACASCHPDGRDDAITWSTPRGPRRSVLLAGRIATTAPYSWNADEPTLADHVTITFDRLNGAGLRGVELDGLVAYISTLPAPPPLDVGSPDFVARGQALFASAETGCASCHTPGHQFTDGSTHDVGSALPIDRDKKFGTPSLRFVNGAGPYFHDGRYSTLHDLLADPKSKMGKSAALAPTDRDALEAYVRTL